ncbi:MAG: NAD(+)/NADH kinase, partial [Cyanobacteriota bacterium]
MPKAGIIYNDIKPAACRLAYELKDKLNAAGWEVHVATGEGGILGYSRPDSPICHTPIDKLAPPGFDEKMSFAIVLGGDGTVLAAFRQVAPYGIPLLTLNTGHMGFLTEAYVNELPRVLDKILAGEYDIEERTMLSVKVIRKDNLWWEALCLNELVLHREPLTCMCHFEIQIGHHALVDIAADGII